MFVAAVIAPPGRAASAIMQTITGGVQSRGMTRRDADFSATLLRALLGAMFFVFAMTTDAVGSIIPKLIDEFRLTLSQASAFHYATMASIAAGALAFGLLADRIGRKATIVIGLAAFAAASMAFLAGDAFSVFIALLVVSGAGISVFKIGALALARRHLDVHAPAHGRDEPDRRLLRRRLDRRPRDRGRAARGRLVVEVAVRHRRRHLRCADHRGAAAALSRRASRHHGTSDAEAHAGAGLRSACARLLRADHALRRHGDGGVRVDADAAAGIRCRWVARHLRADSVLRVPRRRPIPRRVVARHAAVATRARAVRARDLRVLRWAACSAVRRSPSICCRCRVSSCPCCIRA